MNSKNSKRIWVTIFLFSLAIAGPSASSGLSAGMLADCPLPLVQDAQTFAYVTNRNTGDLLVIDADPSSAKFNHCVASVHVGAMPFDVAIAAVADGEYAWVTRPTSDVIKVFDVSNPYEPRVIPTTPVPAGDDPTRVAIVGDRAFVTYSESSPVGVVGVYRAVPPFSEPNAYLHTIAVGAKPTELAVTPDEKYILVSNHAGNSISVIDIDTATPKEVARIQEPNPDPDRDLAWSAIFPDHQFRSPAGIAISPDGSSAYVSHHVPREPGGVAVFDISSLAGGCPPVLTDCGVVPIADIPTDRGPQQIAVAGDSAYVAVEFGRVVKIDTENNVGVPLALYPDQKGPSSIAVSPHGYAYIGNVYSRDIAVIHTNTDIVIKELGVNGESYGVAIWPPPLPPNLPPVADAGLDQTVEATSPLGASVILDGTLSPPDDDPVTFTWTLVDGSPNGTLLGTGVMLPVDLPINTHTISLTVTDILGQTGSDVVVIVVQDTTPPVISSVPAAVTVYATDPAGIAVNLPLPTATDIADPSPVVMSDAPAVFQIGTTTVTFTATDAAGNQSTATTTVTVLPPVAVEIDIKPGSYPNSINLGSQGGVPVAIFSTASFDATTIDPTSVALADAAVKLKGKGTPQTSLADVNGDGLLDLVVHVDTESLELSPSDTEAVLTGVTAAGIPVRGVDTVRIVQGS